MRVLLDTDVGGDFDDANALAFLSGMNDVEIVAVTTVGAGGQAVKRARLASRILRLAGKPSVPVYAGYDHPMMRNPVLESLNADIILNGYEESMVDADISDMHAVDAILELAERYGPDLTIIGIGAATNIATAVGRGIETMKQVGRVVLMAGAFRRQFREANVAIDPEAAQIVLESGMRITAVGMEEASRSQLPLSVYTEAPFVRSLLGSLFAAMAHRYAKAYRTDKVTLYDVTAVAAAVHPELFELETLRAAVELRGAFTRGMTVVEQDQFFNSAPGSRPVTVVRDHDARAVLDLFTTVVLHGAWPRSTPSDTATQGES